jgi:TPR repeat protein
MFEQGKGVAQDRAEVITIRWYRLAAAQGVAEATAALRQLGA